MGKTVAIVDDEKNLNILLAEYLKREGYKVINYFDGLSALENIKQVVDLWILDIMLPDIDGYLLLKEIKKHCPRTPVIFISAKNDQLDRLVGLELGSDDYLPKPFLPRELVIRSKRLLEREVEVKPTLSLDRTELGHYYMDLKGHTVYSGKDEISLTHKEWSVLEYLLVNQDVLITREQILQRVWGEFYFGSDRVVDDTIRRLRKKMDGLPIETIYGAGYKLVNRQ